MHREKLVEAEAEKGVQVKQAVLPEAAAKEVLEQDTHVDEELAPTAVLNVPEVHPIQDAEDVLPKPVEKLPARQLSHWLLDVIPVPVS